MEPTAKERLVALFEQWSGQQLAALSELPPSGSYRQYYRLSGASVSVLGAINQNIKENRAFLEFSRFFHEKGLRVPEIYAVDADMDCYLLEDLGNTTLFDWLSTTRNGREIPNDIVAFYKETLNHLLAFQDLGRQLDFSLCHPRDRFDKQSMLWDLHYFKYYFLKLARIEFDEQELEDDFHRFADFLLQADCSWFLYRDFQSRNIMVVDGKPAFIDYQGGRRGALHYDLASLLYDAKADLPQELRQDLLNHYLLELSRRQNIDEAQFRDHFNGYALIRIMQAMGAYGFRGFYEKKEHFLKSIPFALENLRYLMQQHNRQKDFPSLWQALKEVAHNERLLQISSESTLTVTINSFSYRRGIPIDFSGNGGGFVFDCRAVHNPGRYAAYRDKTGKDPEVIAFFEKEDEMKDFLEGVGNLVDRSVDKYIERGFKHLMVNFGCTGGQHRSVYAAERLATHLKNKYQVNIKLRHIEQEIKKT